MENPSYSAREIFERWTDKDFLFWVNRTNREEFLLENGGGRMKNQYLGACLDYARVGAMNACFWNVCGGGAKGLISFIQNWMDVNKDNLIWTGEGMPEDFELPRINHDVCPRDKNHKGKIVDRGGKTRCAHVNHKMMKPSFIKKSEYFDNFAMMEGVEVYEKMVIDPDDDEFIRFKEEKPEDVISWCYAIISEPKDKVMPLEKVLCRMNINKETERYYCNPNDKCNERKSQEPEWCRGHERLNPWVGYPFDGWALAMYVQKWYEQVKDGKAPVFMQSNEKDAFRMWSNFRVYTSDD